MDTWYARYLADPIGSICRNGRTYYRIIHFWHFTLRSDNEMIVIIDSKVFDRIGDLLLDEHGNEYRVEGVEMLSFRRPIPEWDSTTSSVLLSGDPFLLGEYLARK